MNQKLIALLATFSLALVVFDNATTQVDQFESFKLKFGKGYSDEEEALRFAIWTMNMQEYEEFNAQGLSWKKGENQFTDLTQEEFEAQYLMNDLGQVPEMTNFYTSERSVGDVNWVSQGKVSAVKDQGACGSCWAFSVQSTIESHSAVKRGRLPRLSEQQLVDCDRASGNMGCSGGWPSAAMNYLAGSGICTDASYPYEARNGNCRESSCIKDSFSIAGAWGVSSGSTMSLQSACDSQPISVCVNASPWSGYSSGILTGCSAGTNHAVLLAGYTSSYWLLKNSWGSFWGESGYIRLGPGNECGLANVAYYSY